MLSSKYRLYFVLPFLWIISLFPRNRDIWVYAEGPTNSVLPLLKHAKKRDSAKHIYITPFNSQVDSLRREGILAFHQYSILGCYYISRAKIHVISRRKIEDLNKYLSQGALVVNLFHGMLRPFLNAVHVRESNQGKPQWKINKNRAKMKRLYDRYLLLCSSSTLTQKLQSQQFYRSELSTLPIVGIPRLDRLCKKQTNREYLIRHIDASLTAFDLIFAYTPTVRTGGSEWDNSIDFKKMNEFLLRYNSALIVRPHRLEKSPDFLNKAYSNVYASSSRDKDWNDVIDELIGVDVLISDHSSLLHEFIVSGRPVLPYIPDWDRLLEIGKLEVGFEQELPADRIDDFDQLLVAMHDVVSKTYSYERYKLIADRYHLYQDGKSSERVYDYVVESLNKN